MTPALPSYPTPPPLLPLPPALRGADSNRLPVPQLMGLPRMGKAFARWTLTCQIIDAQRAVAVQAALRRWQAACGESLREALRARTAELTLSRKLMQKPTQLERELREKDAELEGAKEQLRSVQQQLFMQKRQRQLQVKEDEEARRLLER